MNQIMPPTIPATTRPRIPSFRGESFRETTTTPGLSPSGLTLIVLPSLTFTSTSPSYTPTTATSLSGSLKTRKCVLLTFTSSSPAPISKTCEVTPSTSTGSLNLIFSQSFDLTTSPEFSSQEYRLVSVVPGTSVTASCFGTGIPQAFSSVLESILGWFNCSRQSLPKTDSKACFFALTDSLSFCRILFLPDRLRKPPSRNSSKSPLAKNSDTSTTSLNLNHV